MAYRLLIGAYELDLSPAIEIDADRIVRESTNPVTCVAINYVLGLTVTVRRDATDDAAAKLGDELAAYLHTRTCPRVRIQTAAGVNIDEIGLIDESALDGSGVNLGWEDPRIIGFRLPRGDAQLRAGVTFTLTIAARRSFPDADGVCEFDQERETTPDANGNTVIRRTTRLRIAKWTGYTVETAAIAARLREDAEVGWIRTVGAEPLGFAYREPLYPLRHVAETVSEVVLAGVTGGTGSTAAKTGESVAEDPEKGIRRRTYTAENTGGENPLGWVEDQEPGGSLVSTETSSETGSTNTARATWRKVEVINPQGPNGRTAKVRRVFDLTGGRSVIGSVKMSRPIRPHIQRGPFEAYELTESIEVFALGPRGYDDFALPPPLPEPWLLGPVEPGLPRRDEEAVDPDQALWIYPLVRRYAWDSAGDPLTDEALKGAVFLVAPVSGGGGGEPAGGFDFA